MQQRLKNRRMLLVVCGDITAEVLVRAQHDDS